MPGSRGRGQSLRVIRGSFGRAYITLCALMLSYDCLRCLMRTYIRGRIAPEQAASPRLPHHQIHLTPPHTCTYAQHCLRPGFYCPISPDVAFARRHFPDFARYPLRSYCPAPRPQQPDRRPDRGYTSQPQPHQNCSFRPLQALRLPR
jgi:hypothetical protein